MFLCVFRPIDHLTIVQFTWNFWIHANLETIAFEIQRFWKLKIPKHNSTHLVCSFSASVQSEYDYSNSGPTTDVIACIDSYLHVGFFFVWTFDHHSTFGMCIYIWFFITAHRWSVLAKYSNIKDFRQIKIFNEYSNALRVYSFWKTTDWQLKIHFLKIIWIITNILSLLLLLYVWKLLKFHLAFRL